MIAELGPSCNVEEEFSRLVSQYQQQLLHMCTMYLHDESAAEDAVQETFLKAYRSLPQYRHDCSEKTWLMRIAVNTCRDMIRSSWFRHNDRRITPEELQLPSQQRIYDDHFLGCEQTRAMQMVLEELSLPERVAEETRNRMARQVRNAREWCDIVNSFFYRYCGIPDARGRVIYS